MSITVGPVPARGSQLEPRCSAVETARLRMRRLDEADLPALRTLLCDPAVMRYYPELRTDAFVSDWQKGVRALYAAFGYGPWTLELRDGTFVGQCGPLPHALDGNAEIEIVCFLERRFWRDGYAEEASRACIDYAFERIGIPRIVAFVVPENRPSARLALRCGLRFERYLNKDGATMAFYALKRQTAGSLA